MTRESFLADPLRQTRKGEGAIPPEWIREAWSTNQEFRATATSDLLRSINKCGSLFQASGWWTLLRASLSDSQALDLYRTMLTYTQGADTGWVSDFLVGFPHLSGEVSQIRFAGPATHSVERDEPF
jgi:hypothetical protein